MNFITDLLKIVGDFIANIINSIFSFSPLIADLVVMGLASIILCTFAALSFMALTYAERKTRGPHSGSRRPQPGRPAGLAASHCRWHQDVHQRGHHATAADRWVYNLAPLIIAIFALSGYAVLPFAPGVVGTALNVGVLYPSPSALAQSSPSLWRAGAATINTPYSAPFAPSLSWSVTKCPCF